MPYNVSGHFVWIGERTRQLYGAHVEYFRHIQNPIGCKLGPSATADDAIALAGRLNPHNEAGRLTFITRFGAGKIRDGLPELVEKVTAAWVQVAWVCDPMHGNTFESSTGYKTRRFDDVIEEVQGFFDVHRALGNFLAGVLVHQRLRLRPADLGAREEDRRGRPGPPLRVRRRPAPQPGAVARRAFPVAEMLRKA